MNIIRNTTIMYRIFLISMLSIFGAITIGSVFAGDSCTISRELPSTSELRSAIDRCREARSSGNANSITEFMCPQGDFFAENNQPINSDTLPYIVWVSLAFNKVDMDIKAYMLRLQQKRVADPTQWIKEIRSCTDLIGEIYTHLCAFGTLETRINGDDPSKYLLTRTTTYPQELCQIRASAKTQGWYYLETILMSDSISKNQKNSTDSWATEVKWAYGRVLGKWHTYQKILARAVSKMTGYTKASN